MKAAFCLSSGLASLKKWLAVVLLDNGFFVAIAPRSLAGGRCLQSRHDRSER
jgi:hypothetical protein